MKSRRTHSHIRTHQTQQQQQQPEHHKIRTQKKGTQVMAHRLHLVGVVPQSQLDKHRHQLLQISQQLHRDVNNPDQHLNSTETQAIIDKPIPETFRRTTATENSKKFPKDEAEHAQGKEEGRRRVTRLKSAKRIIHTTVVCILCAPSDAR